MPLVRWILLSVFNCNDINSWPLIGSSQILRYSTLWKLFKGISTKVTSRKGQVKMKVSCNIVYLL